MNSAKQWDTKSIFRNRWPSCTPPMNYQKEKLRNNPIYCSNKKKRYLRINLTKEVKDLYSENYRTLKKELKKTQINGRIYCVHGLEELTSLKCTHYPKQSINSTQSLSKYLSLIHI